MSRFLAPLIAIALIASSCTKQRPLATSPEKSVIKNVAFEVYAAKDYSEAFYDNSLAEIKLSIAILNLKNNTTTVAWDTTYDFRQLKQYPQIGQKIRIDKAVEHLENSELLHVSKTVRYNVNGQMSMDASGEGVAASSKLFIVSL